MSGQRRSGPSSERTVAVEQRQQAHRSDMGNQARMTHMGSEQAEVWQQAAALAVGGVQSAGLALHVEVQGPRLVRLLQIVGRSELSEERKVLISERLRADEAVALEVSAAIRSAMGADDPGTRAQLEAALDWVDTGLQQGVAQGQSWRLPSGEAVELDGEGSRAQQLVRGLGELTEVGGTAILAFCQRVHLDRLFEEEEEEDEVPLNVAP